MMVQKSVSNEKILSVINPHRNDFSCRCCHSRGAAADESRTDRIPRRFLRFLLLYPHPRIP
jgi:hypothetical protein